MTASPKANSNTWIVPALLSSGISIATVLCGYWAACQHEKHLRSKWLEEEDQKQKNASEQEIEDGQVSSDAGQTVSYSVIGHFKSLKLGTQSTILEANRRRTTNYYEKARESHEQSLVLGTCSYQGLLEERKEEMGRILFYHRDGKRSLRTVIVMLDPLTQSILSEARQKILQPLNYSWDIYSKGVWIPEISMIPNEDMHVTVACPWWWHTRREGNHELNKDLSNRLRQALVIDFHHPFFIELERIVLLGGKTLVALWRTVGNRVVDAEKNGNDTIVVCDRHATTIDPMVRLRREIVDCFTNEDHEHKFRPLTHQHRKNSDKPTSPPAQAHDHQAPPPIPLPKSKKLVREHTIETKTPGLGSGDGFIHTTLCRLPLGCFSTQDVELEPIHRLCREATATYSGHRMLVHKFRFVETTGEGGDSNPCKNPVFDATIEAPLKMIGGSGDRLFRSTSNSDANSNLEQNARTTGHAAYLSLQGPREGLNTGTALGVTTSSGGIDRLFDPPDRSISSGN